MMCVEAGLSEVFSTLSNCNMPIRLDRLWNPPSPLPSGHEGSVPEVKRPEYEPLHLRLSVVEFKFSLYFIHIYKSIYFSQIHLVL
jgi:hypothetical protein